MKSWSPVLPALEIKELYDLRYAQLMKDKGIVQLQILPP